MEASFYSKLEHEKVRCHLCPHQCLLESGQTGICRVRQNRSGSLVSLNYGKISSKHLDPIEKKPLYHFFPGRQILSIGSMGCNMRCTFCQNCEISQAGIDEYDWIGNYSAEQIVNEARSIPGNLGIAYTYNEPSVFFEFMFDTSLKIQAAGLRNVMVTNGFLSIVPLTRLIPGIDAFNIDLKAFTYKFYKKYTKAQLDPVLESLRLVKHSGKHLEITTLVVPGLNDDEQNFKQMVCWIADELGPGIVLHLSRYFPNYRMNLPPTPEKTLINLYGLAKEKLEFVYIGNVQSPTTGNHTYCPNCNLRVIQRNHYDILAENLTADGCCKDCGYKIAIS